MKSVSKKIEKLNIAVKVFDDEISIENKVLQRTKDKHKELIQAQVLINERLQEMGISPAGAITGHQLKNFSDYRKKLIDSIKHIEQTLSALNIEIQAKSENLRKLVAKKTAALAMIDKLKKHKEKAEEKSLQQIAEIMHTVKNFNQEGVG